jgi:hypothetical protein
MTTDRLLGLQAILNPLSFQNIEPPPQEMREHEDRRPDSVPPAPKGIQPAYGFEESRASARSPVLQ